MGLAKLGLNLAQKTSSWVKACGKTSILQTKTINPTELKGYKLKPLEKDFFVSTTKNKSNDILEEMDDLLPYDDILSDLNLKTICVKDKNFYHGTNSADVVKKEGFKIIDLERNTKLDCGNGIYLTTDKTGASHYGEVLQVIPKTRKVALIEDYEQFMQMQDLQNDLIPAFFKHFTKKGMAAKDIDRMYREKGCSLFNAFLPKLFKIGGYDAVYIPKNASVKQNYDQLIVFNPQNLLLKL